jgi:flagellar protein FlgJ
MELNAQSLIAQTMVNAQTAKTDQAVQGTKKPLNMDKIDAAAKEFEAVFISQMLGHMFESVETDSMFGGGQSEDVYRGMQVEEYGKIITEAGGIGLADTVRSEMIKMQEGLLQ